MRFIQLIYKKIVKNKEIFYIGLIVGFFTILKLIIFGNNLAFFDEGVYIGIAKFFASGGRVGYFEAIRPLALPLLIMPLLWLKINALISGRIIGMLLSVGSIIGIYLSTKKIFGKNPGVWAAFLFSTSCLFLTFAGYALTDIPAYVLGLYGIVLVLRKKYFLGGVVIGLGFLFKFPLGLLIVIASFFALVEEKSGRQACFPPAGFFIASLPYFLFNLFFYEGKLTTRLFGPLLNASRIISNKTTLYASSSAAKYLLFLIKKEPITLAFGLIGFAWLIKNNKPKSTENKAVAIISLSIFAFFSYFSFFVPRLDVRYMLSVMPFLAVLGGVGSGWLCKKSKFMAVLLSLLIIVSGVLTTINLTKGSYLHEKEIAGIIKKQTKGIMTNDALPLIYTTTAVNFKPGPNMMNTLLLYKKSDYQTLIFNPNSYLRLCNTNRCKLKYYEQINYMLNNNKVISCGYLHGQPFIIINKQKPEKNISTNKCLKKINYPLVNYSNLKVHFRIDIGFSKRGEIINYTNTIKILNLLKKNNFRTVLILNPSNKSLSKRSVNFINNTWAEIGILYSKPLATTNFIKRLKNKTKRNISYIMPDDDEWSKKPFYKLPHAKCIKGAWDLTPVSMECEVIDLYVTKNWTSGEFYNSTYLIKEFDKISKIDNNIWIDLPGYQLNNKNFEKAALLVNHISKCIK